MAVWLHHPGDYRSTCPHCGWSEWAGVLTVATARMVLHEETQCRWWDRLRPVVAEGEGFGGSVLAEDPDAPNRWREGSKRKAAAVTAGV